MFIPNPQYVESVREGDFVTFDKKRHKIIFNGEPHIQFRVDGKRVRKYLRELLFEYGTEADYVFNEWWRIFPDYYVFKQFSEHERLTI